MLYDNTEEGASLGATITTLEYFQQMVAKSPLAKSDVGYKGGYEVMQPCRLAVNKIIRDINKGEIKFESVDWDKNRTEIIGKLAETTYQLKQWQTSWNKTEQVIPDEALVVVALAITIATQGTGATLLQGMLTSTFGTVPTITTAGTIAMVPAASLTTAGAAMASAGLTALCTQATTSFLRTGDPIATAKSIFSKDSLKSIGISVASAGLCSKLGSVWGIDANPSLKEIVQDGVKPEFTDFLKSQALKCGVDAGLQVSVGGVDPSQAIASALKQAPIAAIAAWASYNIGDAGFTGELSSEQQDALHCVVGAAYGAVLNPDQPLEGALSGGANAFVAARASKMMFGDPRELREQAEAKLKESGLPPTQENIQMAATEILHAKTAVSTILTAAATAAITKDAAFTSTVIATAMNVTENNCTVSAIKGLRIPKVGGIPGKIVSTLLSEMFAELNISKLYEQIGAEGIFLKLVDEGVIRIQKSTTGQTLYVIGVESFTTAEAAWNAVLWETPVAQTITEKEWAKGRTLKDTFSNAAFVQKVEAAASRSTMDAAPKDVGWRDKGLTTEESKSRVHSTPVHDQKGMDQGFTAWDNSDDTSREGYQRVDDVLDTSVLDLEITESGRFYGTHKELNKIGAKESHHIIQNAAVRDLPGYNKDDAPTLQLFGSSTIIGTEHNVATQIQRESGGGTYGAERRIAYKALRKAGIDSDTARAQIERADSYFTNIGVNKDTTTRLPGTRTESNK